MGPLHASSTRPPGTVAGASWLLSLVAALGLVDAVAAVTTILQLTRRVDAFRAVAGNDFDGRVAEVLNGAVVAAIVSGCALLAMGALAVLVRRPRSWARVAAWVSCALLALVLVCTIAGNPNLFAEPLQHVSAEIQARWDALLPDWYVPVHYACEAGMLVAIVAVGVLLAQTSAHEFYELSRRVAEDDPRLWDIKRRS